MSVLGVVNVKIALVSIKIAIVEVEVQPVLNHLWRVPLTFYLLPNSCFQIGIPFHWFCIIKYEIT